MNATWPSLGMRRVAIIGCSGSGKTTLAHAVGEHFGLPVVHLDTLFYLPDWKPRTSEAFREQIAAALAGDDWVTDGHFAENFDLTVPRAELVVFVHQPRWLSLWRVTRRWLTNRGRTRPDLPDSCPEQVDLPLLKWIWSFERQVRPSTEAVLATYATPVVNLHGDREIAAFVKSLSA